MQTSFLPVEDGITELDGTSEPLDATKLDGTTEDGITELDGTSEPLDDATKLDGTTEDGITELDGTSEPLDDATKLDGTTELAIDGNIYIVEELENCRSKTLATAAGFATHVGQDSSPQIKTFPVQTDIPEKHL